MYSGSSVTNPSLNFSKLWSLKVCQWVGISILVTILITSLFTHGCLNELFWAQVNGKHVLAYALYNHNDTFSSYSRSGIWLILTVFVCFTVLLQRDLCSLWAPFREHAPFLCFKESNKKLVNQNSVLSHHMVQSSHSLALLFPPHELPTHTRSFDSPWYGLHFVSL